MLDVEALTVCLFGEKSFQHATMMSGRSPLQWKQHKHKPVRKSGLGSFCYHRGPRTASREHPSVGFTATRSISLLPLVPLPATGLGPDPDFIVENSARIESKKVPDTLLVPVPRTSRGGSIVDRTRPSCGLRVAGRQFSFGETQRWIFASNYARTSDSWVDEPIDPLSSAPS